MEKVEFRRTALCLSIVLSVSSAAAQGRIVKAVLGTDHSENSEIVNETTVFQPGAPQIVCAWRAEGLMAGTVVRSVWIAEDTAGAAPPNFKIGEASYPNARAGLFSVSRPTKGWPPGRYRLEIYLNKELARTVPFTVAGHSASTPPPARITHAVLGTKLTDDRRIADPVSEFQADVRKIVCRWTSENIAPGTPIRAVWIAENTGGAADPDTKVLALSRTADESFADPARSGTFTMERPAAGWLPGRYRLEIFLGTELARTVHFTIANP